MTPEERQPEWQKLFILYNLMTVVPMTVIGTIMAMEGDAFGYVLVIAHFITMIPRVLYAYRDLVND